MGEQKSKKKKMMDISAPANRKKMAHEKRSEEVIKSENKATDFLTPKAESEFFLGTSKKEIQEINNKIDSEMAQIDEKIEEFEKEEKEYLPQKQERLKEKKPIWRSYAVFITLAVFLSGSLYLALGVLPSAKVNAILKREEWKYEGGVIAGKNISQNDLISKKIPAEVFPIKKNFSFPFPATGKKNVSRSATGVIKIYNETTIAQKLVATTRFESTDGKIFRLESSVVVPAGITENGKLVPGSIEASIYADKAGAEYNIGPIDNLTIPGFKGSEKYEKFSGSIESALKGGLIGESAYPTSVDIASAKAKAREDIESAINYFLQSAIPSEFKVIDAAKKFTIKKEVVSDIVDEKGNFSVFIDAEITVVAFKEKDLLQLLADVAKTELKTGKEMKKYALEYGTASYNDKKGELTFNILYSSEYVPDFDANKFKTGILGKKEGELRDFVYGHPEIDRASVSFWPLWVSKIPKNLEKITIIVE